MYHVVANIDDRFSSAEAALAAYRGKVVRPKIPYSTSWQNGEDATTPRICVCENIKDCVTAIGLLGRFRRCLAANEDAKSYETDGIEVYPILILKFSDDLKYYTPNRSQVPDVDFTHERWLLKPAVPDFVQIAWVHPRSIIWEECKENPVSKYACKALELIIAKDGPIGRTHPWITGTGHRLESSEMESISLSPCDPEIEALDKRFAYIYKDGGMPIRSADQVPAVKQKLLSVNAPDSEWQQRINNSWWSAKKLKENASNLNMTAFSFLHDLLLSFGGYETCFPRIEEDMESILLRGQFWLGDHTVLVKGQPNQCHANACNLWENNKDKAEVAIATGYALSKDGLWRQHSWLLHRRPRSVEIVETTKKRVCYFGFVMTEKEAEEFCDMNW